MQEKLITQSTVISMGFTKSMITKLLPPPKEVPNPHYRCAAPMKLWNENDVKKAMESDAFNELIKKAAKRKEAAKKATQTKTNNLKWKMATIGQSLTIAIIPDDELINRTLAAKRDWITSQLEFQLDGYYWNLNNRYNTLEYLDEMELIESQLSDIKENGLGMPNEETLYRWIVNYIRHNLVNYDNNLKLLNGQTGKQYGYESFKDIVLRKIAAAYPKYNNECQRQIDEMKSCEQKGA